jgi:RHS repeat-associated protein
MLLQRHHSRVCRKRHKTIQSDGQVAWQWAYSAFGDEQPTIAKNRFANLALNQSFGSTTVATVTFNLRYPGQYFDQESNLHYNYHRSYSATVGRYTQSDPIGLDGGWNRFGYAEQNPVSFTDPKGLAGCHYSVTTGTFACSSNDGKSPPIVIPPGSTHSGRNSCKDNPNCFDETNDGPIPPSCYIPEPHDSKPGFWRLIPVGGQSKADSLLCRLGLKRCGFQLHVGTVSLGCITVSTSALQIYTKVSDLLSKEYPNNLICVGVD